MCVKKPLNLVARIRPSLWLLIVVMAVAIGVRIYFSRQKCLSVDERILMSYAQGVQERGYPSKFLGNTLNPLTTYELSAYLLALAGACGLKGLSVRVVPLLFSVGVMVFVWRLGRRFFSEQVSIIALLLYLFSHLAINFSYNAFHVQYDQFWYLLCVWCFFNFLKKTATGEQSELKGRGPDKAAEWLRWFKSGLTGWTIKDGLIGGLAGSCLYLSWEGSIFGLFTIFLLLVYEIYLAGSVRQYQKASLLTVYGLFFFGTVGLTFFLQISWRLVHSFPHLLVGVTPFFFTPTLAFLHAQYDPWFILNNFVLVRENLPLIILSVLFLLFLRRMSGRMEAGTRLDWYVFSLYGLPSLMTQLFLLHPISHYFYYLYPFLCISAAQAIIILYRKTPGLVARGAILLIIFLLYSPWPFRFDFGALPQDIPYHSYPELYWVEYGRIFEHLKRIDFNDTILIHTVPHVVPDVVARDKVLFPYISPVITIFYDPADNDFHLHDKFNGTPVISGEEELYGLMSKYKNIYWLVFNRDLFDAFASSKIREFLHQHFRLLIEEGNADLLKFER